MCDISINMSAYKRVPQIGVTSDIGNVCSTVLYSTYDNILIGDDVQLY